jgi:maltose/moltooligosaccharide transporter
VRNFQAGGGIPDTVLWSFYLGGAALLASVLWTVLTTREYSPAELAAFEGHELGAHDMPPVPPASTIGGVVWIAAGLVLASVVAVLRLEKELYLLGGLVAFYGIARLAAGALYARGSRDNLLTNIVGDFSSMPPIMKRLALTQFFTWSALFIMWIYTTPVVAQYVYGSADPASEAYNQGGNWVGIMFAAYNLVAAIVAAFLLQPVARRFGKVRTHASALAIGAVSFLSFFVIRTPAMLLLAEVGIGIAWASILAMPYAILASSLPQRKLGIYMGLFNVFVVVPQLLVATIMGTIMKHFFPTEPIWTMAFAAAVMALAAVSMLRVREDAVEG